MPVIILILCKRKTAFDRAIKKINHIHETSGTSRTNSAYKVSLTLTQNENSHNCIRLSATFLASSVESFHFVSFRFWIVFIFLFVRRVLPPPSAIYLLYIAEMVLSLILLRFLLFEVFSFLFFVCRNFYIFCVCVVSSLSFLIQNCNFHSNPIASCCMNRMRRSFASCTVAVSLPSVRIRLGLLFIPSSVFRNP